MRLFPLLLLLPAIAAAETHPFGVRDMLAMQRIGEQVVSPDGRQVAFSLRTSDIAANRGRFDLWLTGVDGTGLRQLTKDEGNETAPAWSADGRTVYFLSTATGSSQVFRMPAAGGTPEQVTKLARDVDMFTLAPGSDRLVVAMSVLPGRTPEQTAAYFDERSKAKMSAVVFEHALVRHWDTWSDGTRNHLFAVDASGTARDLMPNMDADTPTKPYGGRSDTTFSPDGLTLVFVARDVGREEAWSTNMDLFSVPVDGSAAPKKLTTNPALDVTPVFSPDGRRLAWLAMTRPGFEADRQDVMLRDLATGQDTRFVVRAGTGPDDDRSPDEMVFSADGRELLLSAYHLGHRAAFAMDVARGRTRVLVPEGHVSGVVPAGDRILFARDSLLSPVELYTIGRDGRGEKAVTRINAGRIAAARWGTPEAFTFTGGGDDKVYGWLVKPVDFDPAKKYPLALLIHGGPQSSMSNLFHYRWNPEAYAGAGYVAVAIDFHGSMGYGQAFTDAISHDWSGKPFEDMQKGLDHVVAKYPFVDGSRACALGASYGGYMVNWIAGQPFADRFKCLVTHDGNLDERAAYFMTEELWFPEWEHGLPWENPEGYTKGNPVLYVQNWHVPHLVVHGAKDYRIVEAQGIATFNALQRRGVPSKFLYFPDEGHWVLKPANSLLWHETVLGWLDQWTKN